MLYLNFLDKFYVAVEQRVGSDFSASAGYFRKHLANRVPAGSDLKVLKIVCVEDLSAAGLLYLGKEAAYNDTDFYLLDKQGRKLKFAVDQALNGEAVLVESGFDEHKLLAIVQSLVFFGLLHAGVIPVHSCSVALDGQGVLFPAWAGVGKTRVIMNLTANGAGYLSDEWTFIKDSTLFPLGRDICLLDYDLAEYSDRAGLSFWDRARLCLSLWTRPKRLRALLQRFGLLLTYKEYGPSRLFAVAAASAPLKKLFLLQRSDQQELSRVAVPREELLGKMTVSFCREMGGFLYYDSLYRFARPGAPDLAGVLADLYRRTLASAIKRVECAALVLPRQINDIDLKGAL
ncbi:MAG: hypothetical protein JW782_00840 [Candidatus Saganbacteria bacterium]|nr:hypothetical protein [Candidatus Saganbacteria bacterium]